MVSGSATSSIKIRVVWDDSELIELETVATIREFSGVATAYTSPNAVKDAGNELVKWSRDPTGECRIEFGNDNGTGWIVLRFYTIGLAERAYCQVTIATRGTLDRPETVARMSNEMETEPGLIERFAKHLEALSDYTTEEAILSGF